MAAAAAHAGLLLSPSRQLRRWQSEPWSPLGSKPAAARPAFSIEVAGIWNLLLSESEFAIKGLLLWCVSFCEYMHLQLASETEQLLDHSDCQRVKGQRFQFESAAIPLVNPSDSNFGFKTLISRWLGSESARRPAEARPGESKKNGSVPLYSNHVPIRQCVLIVPP